MQKDLFRKTALERLGTPEQLDQRLQVTTRPGWLIAIALFCLLIALIIWSFATNVPLTISGQGILMRGEGIIQVMAPAASTISSFAIQPGASVKRGQVLAHLETDQTPDVSLLSPLDGRILEFQNNIGDRVAANETILTLEETDEPLEAVIYLSPSDSQKVSPGQTVQISLDTIPVGEYGFLIGQVATVSDFPASTQRMLRLLGSQSLVDSLSASGKTIEVRVTLQTSTDNPSGYAWSSSKGPDVSIRSGTLTTSNVLLGSVHPIELLFPTLLKGTGQ